KLHPQGCVGAPDLVVEVLSPSTAYKDKKSKLKAYRAAGVREYWMVDPHLRLVEVCLLEDGDGFPTVYGKEDTVPVSLFADLSIRLQEIFG
ncbi:MAG: Uma2 family endonuclease, partial [Firmicutes bacterium]|nr:Uma2 family endonuclease [Bacillota bacterium]